MLTKKSLQKTVIPAVASLAFMPQVASSQHVHGVVELGIAVDGGELSVSLRAPLDDVVGFEHAPKTQQQKEAIEQAANVLASPASMFGTPAGAQCRVEATDIDGPDYITSLITEKDHHDQKHEGHEDHGHDEHDHDEHHDEHSEIQAEYRWHCEDAAALDAMEPRFVQHFSGIETVAIQIVTATGARVIEADGSLGTIPLADD